MDLPNNADVVLSPAQNLLVITISQLFMLCGRLVHEGETFNKIADLGL